jgi:hypothetical protein
MAFSDIPSSFATIWRAKTGGGGSRTPVSRPVNDATPWTGDDIDNDDEDLTVSSNNHIYSTDGPGFPTNLRAVLADASLYVGDFREWVEVKLDGCYYQCSDYYKWHARTYVIPKDSLYMTRDDPGKQKLGEGWIVVPDQADEP